MKFLDSAKRQFELYKQLGEKAMLQIDEPTLQWQPNEDTNSIALIVKHMWGNMLSRWTDFLTTDGEKPWRNRDEEFKLDKADRAEIMERWNAGWACLYNTLNMLREDDLDTIIYIRNDGLTVLEAINRQLSHYCYHVGQIVFIAKMLRSTEWHSLSIARDKSNDYNDGKFAMEKKQRDFTDDLMK